MQFCTTKVCSLFSVFFEILITFLISNKGNLVEQHFSNFYFFWATLRHRMQRRRVATQTQVRPDVQNRGVNIGPDDRGLDLPRDSSGDSRLSRRILSHAGTSSDYDCCTGSVLPPDPEPQDLDLRGHCRMSRAMSLTSCIEQSTCMHVATSGAEQGNNYYKTRSSTGTAKGAAAATSVDQLPR